jgi:hypothetical protein
VEQTEDRLTVEIDGDDQLVGTVVQALVQNGVAVLGVEREQRNLETLFMRVTQGKLA